MSTEKKVLGINGVELPMTMATYEENTFITKKDWHLAEIASGSRDNRDQEHFDTLKTKFGITDDEIKAACLKRDLNKALPR